MFRLQVEFVSGEIAWIDVPGEMTYPEAVKYLTMHGGPIRKTKFIGRIVQG